MIEIRALDFRYRDGAFRLRIPELRIEKGSKVALIGPSGSGKTTLLHLIAGILVPASGQIAVNGVQVGGLGDAARRNFRIANVGFVFQDFELVEYLDVLDNIVHPYRLNDALRLTRDVRAHALALAGEVGIDDKLARSVTRLSQGEKQHVAICRALLTRPPLLLADEATGNLDPANKAVVLRILLDYVERSGAALLAATHDHELLDDFDRVIDFRDFADGGAS
jgi:putative ABC transport system ATP-binding protein